MSFLQTPMRRTLGTLPTFARQTAHRHFSTTQPRSLARLTLVGRLGADPELVDTPSGTSLVRYVVGTSHGSKDNRQTSWFRVASFSAEGSAQREYLMGLTKGTLVYLEGDATMKSFEDAEGKKQSALNLVQTKLEVLKRPQPVEGESS